MIFCFLLFCSTVFAAPGYPKPASVTTADGVQLAASMAVPAKASRGVLLLHQDGRGKEDWDSLGRRLHHSGYAVLAVDLRTQGANATADRPTTAEDYAAMQADVASAITLLKSKGVVDLCIVGAELGANLAVNAALPEPGVASLVLLSPSLEVRGIIASDAVPRYGARSLLLVAGEDDRAGARAAGVLDSRALGVHELRLLERGGRGVQLLLRDPSLEGVIAGWIGTHWDAKPVVEAPSRLLDLLGPPPEP